jgi:hypothetical protein
LGIFIHKVLIAKDLYLNYIHNIVSRALLYGGAMSEDFVQVRADIPRYLKRRVFAILALRGETFNQCVQRALEAFVHENTDLADYLRGVKAAEDTSVAVTK